MEAITYVCNTVGNVCSVESWNSGHWVRLGAIVWWTPPTNQKTGFGHASTRPGKATGHAEALASTARQVARPLRAAIACSWRARPPLWAHRRRGDAGLGSFKLFVLPSGVFVWLSSVPRGDLGVVCASSSAVLNICACDFVVLPRMRGGGASD
jgi:hypothetical protein